MARATCSMAMAKWNAKANNGVTTIDIGQGSGLGGVFYYRERERDNEKDKSNTRDRVEKLVFHRFNIKSSPDLIPYTSPCAQRWYATATKLIYHALSHFCRSLQRFWC